MKDENHAWVAELTKLTTRREDLHHQDQKQNNIAMQ